MNEEHSPPVRQAPAPVAGARVLLWVQGTIWAALGAVCVAPISHLTTAAGLITATLFGFAVVSGTLAVLLRRPGSNRARHATIVLQCFMAFLGLAVLICSGFSVMAGAFFLALPVGLVALIGFIAAGCAVGGLRSAPAREYCRPPLPAAVVRGACRG